MEKSYQLTNILGVMKTALICTLILLLTACGTSRKLTTVQSDSVRVEVVKTVEYIHDTVTVEIPAQTAERTTRDSSSHLENDFAESDARINSDGTLYHDLRTKPQEKEIPVEVPKERKDSIIYHNIEVENIVPVERELTKWQRTQMRGFWVVLVVLVVYVFRKPFLALIRRFI